VTLKRKFPSISNDVETVEASSQESAKKLRANTDNILVPNLEDFLEAVSPLFVVSESSLEQIFAINSSNSHENAEYSTSQTAIEPSIPLPQFSQTIRLIGRNITLKHLIVRCLLLASCFNDRLSIEELNNILPYTKSYILQKINELINEGIIKFNEVHGVRQYELVDTILADQQRLSGLNITPPTFELEAAEDCLYYFFKSRRDDYQRLIGKANENWSKGYAEDEFLNLKQYYYQLIRKQEAASEPASTPNRAVRKNKFLKVEQLIVRYLFLAALFEEGLSLAQLAHLILQSEKYTEKVLQKLPANLIMATKDESYNLTVYMLQDAVRINGHLLAALNIDEETFSLNYAKDKMGTIFPGNEQMYNDYLAHCAQHNPKCFLDSAVWSIDLNAYLQLKEKFKEYTAYSNLRLPQTDSEADSSQDSELSRAKPVKAKKQFLAHEAVMRYLVLAAFFQEGLTLTELVTLTHKTPTHLKNIVRTAPSNVYVVTQKAGVDKYYLANDFRVGDDTLAMVNVNQEAFKLNVIENDLTIRQDALWLIFNSHGRLYQDYIDYARQHNPHQFSLVTTKISATDFNQLKIDFYQRIQRTNTALNGPCAITTRNYTHTELIQNLGLLKAFQEHFKQPSFEQDIELTNTTEFKPGG